ncbi:MAG: ribonuclease III [Pseudomonadota bacterium]
MRFSPECGNLDKLGEKLGYFFKEPDLLEEAFRHASYVNENAELNLRDNERLEFLGDAVLDLAISHILMSLFEDAKEGDLSKYRAYIVSEKGLSQVATALGLGDCILLGKGERVTHGETKPSILANTMEALMGALYLDAGFPAALEIIVRLFTPILEEIDLEQVKDDYKSLLQEYTQETHKTRPHYQMVSESGPAHCKTFKVALTLNGERLSEADGNSKKEAEQKAAKEAYFCLTKEREDP